MHKACCRIVPDNPSAGVKRDPFAQFTRGAQTENECCQARNALLWKEKGGERERERERERETVGRHGEREREGASGQEAIVTNPSLKRVIPVSQRQQKRLGGVLFAGLEVDKVKPLLYVLIPN